MIPGCVEALAALGLSEEELLAFQREMASQGRNWELALVCAFDAGVPSFSLLMDWVEGSRIVG